MDPSQFQPQDPTAIPAGLPLAAPSLGSTFGAIMLSTFFSLMLYGLTAHQTFRYFRMYGGDIPFFKILVLAIFAADTFHSATLMHMCYYYFVVNYFNPLAFLVSTWSIQALPLSTGVTVLLTQSFYVRRIYLVDRRYLPIVLLVVILMFVELAFIIFATVESFSNDTFEGLSGHIWIDTTLFAVAASTDLILTGTLVFILRNSYTRFERTNTVLDTLSLYAVIATGLNTALTVPAFVCSIALPQTFAYFAIAMPATKGASSVSMPTLHPLAKGDSRPESLCTVYSNSVLAVLNCRQALTGHIGGSSNYTPQRTLNRTGPTSPGASAAQASSDSVRPRLLIVSPASSYAMVRIQMAGREDVGVRGDSESVDAKMRSPEPWSV
ncbi:hypothetical protein LXA43DRAFT_1100910 [Ganoderma leucocontextum]|nr:hypothetical protein LXA43DRAFT_1100910 [Ganoderma leucocontextum]